MPSYIRVQLFLVPGLNLVRGDPLGLVIGAETGSKSGSS